MYPKFLRDYRKQDGKQSQKQICERPNQEVNNQGVEIEPNGGNANEVRENPQTLSWLDYGRQIFKWLRTQKGSDRGNTNQDGQGGGRGNTNQDGQGGGRGNTNPDGKGGGRGKTNQDGKGGARTEGKVVVTAVPKEPSRPLSLFDDQGVEINPDGGNANEEQGKPQTHKGGDITNQAGKGRDEGNTNKESKGEARAEAKATIVLAGEDVAAVPNVPPHLPVPRQATRNPAFATVKEKEKGNIAKRYLDLCREKRVAREVFLERRDEIREERLRVEKVQMQISKEKDPIRLKELRRKLTKLSRGFRPELENRMQREAGKAREAATRYEVDLREALRKERTVTVTSEEDIQIMDKEVRMKFKPLIRADDCNLIKYAREGGFDFLLY